MFWFPKPIDFGFPCKLFQPKNALANKILCPRQTILTGEKSTEKPHHKNFNMSNSTIQQVEYITKPQTFITMPWPMWHNFVVQLRNSKIFRITEIVKYKLYSIDNSKKFTIVISLFRKHIPNKYKAMGETNTRGSIRPPNKEQKTLFFVENDFGQKCSIDREYIKNETLNQLAATHL